MIPVAVDLPVYTEQVSVICSTHTATVRNVSERLKRDIYRRDGVPGGNHTGICSGREGCEVDHVVSLTTGGNNSPENLKIMPYEGKCNARQKDVLENYLHRRICAGVITPREAQEIQFYNWEEGYKKYIDNNGCDK